MSDNTEIEWTDDSWNPLRARDRATGKVGWHCVHVSEGCRNCYAETFNGRFGAGRPYKPAVTRGGVEIFIDQKILLKPLSKRRGRRIFVGSMTDIFADFVKDAMLDQIFAIMALTPQHTYQVLTKRPERMRAYVTAPDTPARIIEAALFMKALPSDWQWPLPNVWLGVSAEDQPRAEERIPQLLATPAAVRFMSAEPLLGGIEVGPWLASWCPQCRRPLIGGGHFAGRRCGTCHAETARLDWVIVGGESGPGSRPMHPAWARQIRDACAAGSVPFFFKQWGVWAPGESAGPVTGPQQGAYLDDSGWSYTAFSRAAAEDLTADDEPDVWRVGKKAAGRLLDGIEHNAMPRTPFAVESPSP